MHGWTFIGSRSASFGQRIFWLFTLSTFMVLAGYLVKMNISAYDNSVTTIKIDDRTADLSDAYFPSVVICNINQLRKSFIYWLHENIHENGLLNEKSIHILDVFSLVKTHFFRGHEEGLHEHFTPEDQDELLDLILESKFYEEKFDQFYIKNLDALNLIVSSDNNLVHYDDVYDAKDLLGEYSNLTKLAYHKSFLQAMAGQWTIGQMILMIKWRGNGDGIWYQTGYSTDYGVCQWVTPDYNFSGSDEFCKLLDLRSIG